MSQYAMGVDIGGSHISAGLVDIRRKVILEQSILHHPVDSMQSAGYILDVWYKTIQSLLRSYNEVNISSIGIAMPGPFDYKRGISKISGVNKFDYLFAVHIKQYLCSNLNYPAKDIHFINDAGAFALGEFNQTYCAQFRSILALTLGTGFGSAFIYEGKLQSRELYHLPYKESIADDYFSTRWFVRNYNKQGHQKIENVKQLADRAAKGEQKALDLFQEFGQNLADFLKDQIQYDIVECCVIGGNISKAWPYFSHFLIDGLTDRLKIEIVQADSNAHTILSGAALFKRQNAENSKPKRKTTQFLLPHNIQKTSPGKYDIYPGFEVPENVIKSGYKNLADFMSAYKRIVIDGFMGVFWDDLRQNLDLCFKSQGIKVVWYDISAVFKDPEEIDELIEPFLGGDDPIFGYKTDLSLIDFFEDRLLANVHPDSDADLCVLYGTGASLGGWDAPVIYVDLPKNELQYRMRAGAICNLGAIEPQAPKKMYKRCYFVDWVVLGKHKQQVAPKIDVFVDDQKPGHPFWINGQTVRDSLNAMSKHFFRVRPWFEPGPWGGQWMKEHIDQLSPDVPNYAWSFELIVPENGLLLQDGDKMLELSFDFLMFQEYENVLGEAAKRFKYDFPIRFDFLDTFEGGNLSIQVHPQQDFFVKEFGEFFTQDECYYIIGNYNICRMRFCG